MYPWHNIKCGASLGIYIYFWLRECRASKCIGTTECGCIGTTEYRYGFEMISECTILDLSCCYWWRRDIFMTCCEKCLGIGNDWWNMYIYLEVRQKEERGFYWYAFSYYRKLSANKLYSNITITFIFLVILCWPYPGYWLIIWHYIFNVIRSIKLSPLRTIWGFI